MEIKPFSEDISRGSEKYTELELQLGPADWQKLRSEIQRWKKSGGILKAKLKGKEDKAKQEKRINELVSKRGPTLTEDEEDEIAVTPGVIPPWFPKNPGKDNYYYGAIKAIKELGVSALDVHLAVERDYTDESLTDKEREILRVGWGVKKYGNVIPHGEFYHKDKGWY